VGKVVQPLQSVNCHYSHAHGHERHGTCTRLVGFLVRLVLVWVYLGRVGMQRVEACEHSHVFGATRVRLVSLGRFWLQG
jgi:hypothetical protein